MLFKYACVTLIVLTLVSPSLADPGLVPGELFVNAYTSTLFTESWFGIAFYLNTVANFVLGGTHHN